MRGFRQSIVDYAKTSLWGEVKRRVFPPKIHASIPRVFGQAVHSGLNHDLTVGVSDWVRAGNVVISTFRTYRTKVQSRLGDSLWTAVFMGGPVLG